MWGVSTLEKQLYKKDNDKIVMDFQHTTHNFWLLMSWKLKISDDLCCSNISQHGNSIDCHMIGVTLIDQEIKIYQIRGKNYICSIYLCDTRKFQVKTSKYKWALVIYDP